ncbi:MAG: glycosyltransferase [Clostridia bacterium]|nr:glycosyltransferase [Clostridia bacterium]
MIKILFFIETLSGGGAEKVLQNLVNNMDKEKFDITVQTVWRENPEKYLNKNIRYKYIYPCYSKLNNYKYRLSVFLKTIYPLHIKDNYDIEVAYLECGATKVISTSTNKKAKKIAWVHCDLSKKLSNINEFKTKSVNWYKKFDKVVCVSRDVENSFKSIYGNEFDTEVIYNVIDDYSIKEKADETVDDYSFYEKTPTIVSVGRLSKQKRFDRLIEAHRLLLDDGISNNLLIIGEGGERVNLEQTIISSGVQRTVTLSGFKSNPYPYIKNADLLAISSDYEGFSSFVAEGLILGKAIVTTKCNGMEELLGSSQYGIITECDAKALSEGIKKLLADNSLKEEYERNAIERGRGFSIEASVKVTEDFFVFIK